ncbi:prepilin-type N-terminal cleavage/methylation domain-containing protein [Agaribacter flavus]|uniref:Prepilin-type N-terminal cleavage/methylation domain-containing protein n=1 Tax=Agaribacter flavus TaxID=1902781 RepID=A0ABV7FTB8_9ALTE
MCRKFDKLPVTKGFTIVEVLVVLVIVGLLSAVIAPNIFQWIKSSQNAAIDREVQSFFSALPIQAKMTNTPVRFKSEQAIQNLPKELSKFTFFFDPDLIVLSSGLCKGSTLTIAEANSVTRVYSIDPPYCYVQLQN